MFQVFRLINDIFLGLVCICLISLSLCVVKFRFFLVHYFINLFCVRPKEIEGKSNRPRSVPVH